MMQMGLIKRVIEALMLDDGYGKGKHTPAESKPLVEDADRGGVLGGFSYSSIVRMPLYLSGHTQPNIAYAVNYCARNMFYPKHSHKLALKRIGRYLKQLLCRTSQVARLLSSKNYWRRAHIGIYAGIQEILSSKSNTSSPID
jgi:hypothetical protein